MIKLDIEEDNSEILEYVLKVAYKFYPMVYEDSKGIMHVGGTKADEEFEYYYNKGEVNFLSYNEYLAYSGGYPFSISGDIRSLPS